jgi:hypothetical protein
MKKILLIHCSNGLGLHFLDWSIYFLFGASCISDPLTEPTAHGHAMTIVRYPDELENDLPLVSQALGILHYDLARQQGKTMADTDVDWRQHADHLIFDNFDKIIHRAKKLDYQVVIADWHPDHWLIPTYSHRQPLAYDTGSKCHKDMVMQSYEQTFFPDSQRNWNDQFVWDLRERYALVLRPNLLWQNPVSRLIEIHHDVYHTDTKLLWFDLLSVIKSIFQLSELRWEQSRLAHWYQIYSRWQLIHDVKFSTDYWSILNSIVNGDSMDLSIYNIDLIKEALIQHGLIYKHDLNLKTWQLDKLPGNTADIYQLLEKNIHPRDFTYPFGS